MLPAQTTEHHVQQQVDAIRQEIVELRAHYDLEVCIIIFFILA